MAGRLRALRVVHPFPSILNAALVLALAVTAGGAPIHVALLTIGMLGIQLCIGAVNDLADEDLDRRTKSWKPIPAGLVSRRTALIVALASGAAGLLAALLLGPAVFCLLAIMLGCGLVYDLLLKPSAWAWACFSVAFAVLPIYAWYGSAGTLPPLPEFLIPIAALAGPALQLSNGLIDLERDTAGGIETLATRLGRKRTLAVIAILLVVIYVVAWATLAATGSTVSRILVGVATVVALVGFGLSAAAGDRLRAAGWTAQAVAIALLAFGWLSAI